MLTAIKCKSSICITAHQQRIQSFAQSLHKCGRRHIVFQLKSACAYFGFAKCCNSTQKTLPSDLCFDACSGSGLVAWCSCAALPDVAAPCVGAASSFLRRSFRRLCEDCAWLCLDIFWVASDQQRGSLRVVSFSPTIWIFLDRHHGGKIVQPDFRYAGSGSILNPRLIPNSVAKTSTPIKRSYLQTFSVATVSHPLLQHNLPTCQYVLG